MPSKGVLVIKAATRCGRWAHHWCIFMAPVVPLISDVPVPQIPTVEVVVGLEARFTRVFLCYQIRARDKMAEQSAVRN